MARGSSVLGRLVRTNPDAARAMLVALAVKHGGDRSAMAAALGVHRSTVDRAEARLGVDLDTPVAAALQAELGIDVEL